ncbi:MAG: DUF1727 domain-containing protein [Oscillospiraceae bacterium]|nr:DUF1727 domain-containing protein [Oscillospiraceae bacterium]
MNLKAILAIALCKLLRLLSRLLGRGGTAMPGRWALKLCPDLLARLSKNVKTVVITGTNGKTTSARIVEQAFREQGLSYLANRSGANLLSGVTTEFVMNCTLGGKMKKEYAVIECDEAATVKVFPQLRPQVVIVTNLFRDQLDRFGEVTHTLGNIRTALESVPEATICLNADCSLCSSLALSLPNRAVYFGLEQGAVPSRAKAALSDATHCIRCKTEYEYDYVSYGHLGGFRCPKCGYARHAADYAVTELIEQRSSGSTVAVSIRGEKQIAEINLPALYNVYNAIGALAASVEMGVEKEKALHALAVFKGGFGRMEAFQLGRADVRMMLIKNPAGCNQVIDYLEGLRNRFVLVICLNDRGADGTDVSWIWDAEFERLNSIAGRIEKIIVSGDRAQDMRVRLKYAGIPDASITVEHDYEKIVSSLETLETDICLMPTYTATLELREVMVRHCGGKQFWEG